MENVFGCFFILGEKCEKSKSVTELSPPEKLLAAFWSRHREEDGAPSEKNGKSGELHTEK